MPARVNGGFYIYDLGEEIAPGFHVGDRIRYKGEEGWVSNIAREKHGRSGQAEELFVITDDDPNELLKEDPNELCHGDYVYDLAEVTLLDCMHPAPVTEEEVAELFGLTLLELVEGDAPTL